MRDARTLALLCALALPLLAPPATQAQPVLTPAQAAARQAEEERKGRKAAEAEAQRLRQEKDAQRQAQEAQRAENERLRRELEQLKRAKPSPGPSSSPALAQPSPTRSEVSPAVPAAAPAPAAAATPAPSRYRRLEDLLQVPGCEACGQMALVPAGVFDMGSAPGSPGHQSDEAPVRRGVQVAAFEIGRTEVTQAQWRAVMGNNPSHFSECGDACPVERVSWNEIAGEDGFLARLNKRLGLSGAKAYRLPTEAEWEYATRAGHQTAYWWGDQITPERANYRASQLGGTVRADAYADNPWGLHNVHGNVWEWVADCWHDNYQGAPATAQEWTSNCSDSRRVVRGGSWIFRPDGLRSAYRNGDAPVYRDYNLGFRLARTF